MIILGASARAAAASALRAGFAPWCADLFADADLARACPVRKVATAHYPAGLIAAAREAPPGPWMYTGALENRPDIVGKIDRPLWGISPQVLRRVRSPFLLADALRRHGLSVPIVCAGTFQTSPHRRYLVKPYHSAGGCHIRMFDGAADFNPRRCYLQEWIDGESCSAVFIGDARGRAQLLGATRQLVGESWLAAAPFAWCGNVGPLTLEQDTAATLLRIGQTIAAEFALCGLFGIDFILRDGVPWPVEVNPRYPASVEVLERASGQPLLAAHAKAFGGCAPAARTRPAYGKVVAKAILFARQSLMASEYPLWQTALEMPLDDLTVPFADLPATSTRIEVGQPICSVFAGADSQKDCLAQMCGAVAELERRLTGR